MSPRADDPGPSGGTLRRLNAMLAELQGREPRWRYFQARGGPMFFWTVERYDADAGHEHPGRYVSGAYEPVGPGARSGRAGAFRLAPNVSCQSSRTEGDQCPDSLTTSKPPRILTSMSTVAERLDADAYLAREDPRRTELIDGVVIVNQPSVLHQRVCARIHRALEAWTGSEHGRGEASWPLDVRLDDGTVLAPDVLWFAEPLPADATRAPRLPELAVEVRSGATWVYDVGPKRARYERDGLGELWLADTASRTLLVYRRSQPEAGFDVALELAADETLTSPLLAGFAVLVSDLLVAAA